MRRPRNLIQGPYHPFRNPQPQSGQGSRGFAVPIRAVCGSFAAGSARGRDRGAGGKLRAMPRELAELLRARSGEALELHAEYVNPQMVRVLRTIGFDRDWARTEGAYLYDAEGERYLDWL